VFFLFDIASYIFNLWVYFDIILKLLFGKNTQKVNKQKIRDSKNWVFDELNEIFNFNFGVKGWSANVLIMLD